MAAQRLSTGAGWRRGPTGPQARPRGCGQPARPGPAIAPPSPSNLQRRPPLPPFLSPRRLRPSAPAALSLSCARAAGGPPGPGPVSDTGTRDDPGPLPRARAGNAGAESRAAAPPAIAAAAAAPMRNRGPRDAAADPDVSRVRDASGRPAACVGRGRAACRRDSASQGRGRRPSLRLKRLEFVSASPVWPAVARRRVLPGPYPGPPVENPRRPFEGAVQTPGRVAQMPDRQRGEESGSELCLPHENRYLLHPEKRGPRLRQGPPLPPAARVKRARGLAPGLRAESSGSVHRLLQARVPAAQPGACACEESEERRGRGAGPGRRVCGPHGQGLGRGARGWDSGPGPGGAGRSAQAIAPPAARAPREADPGPGRARRRMGKGGTGAWARVSAPPWRRPPPRAP